MSRPLLGSPRSSRSPPRAAHPAAQPTPASARAIGNLWATVRLPPAPQGFPRRAPSGRLPARKLLETLAPRPTPTAPLQLQTARSRRLGGGGGRGEELLATSPSSQAGRLARPGPRLAHDIEPRSGEAGNKSSCHSLPMSQKQSERQTGESLGLTVQEAAEEIGTAASRGKHLQAQRATACAFCRRRHGRLTQTRFDPKTADRLQVFGKCPSASVRIARSAPRACAPGRPRRKRGARSRGQSFWEMPSWCCRKRVISSSGILRPRGIWVGAPRATTGRLTSWAFPLQTSPRPAGRGAAGQAGPLHGSA